MLLSQIYVRIRDTEWNIYRRYAQFHALYKELKKHDAVITTFEFPPKKTIRNKVNFLLFVATGSLKR